MIYSSLRNSRQCPAKQGGMFEPGTEESELLKRALHVLYGWTIFDAKPEKIESEKQVVIEEWRVHHNETNAQISSSKDNLINSGTPYEDREPIGDTRVIEAATPALLKNFFYKWYRPENISIIVVGDIANTYRVIELISSEFSQMRVDESIPPGVWPSIEPFDPKSPFRVKQMSCSESSHVFCSFILAEPFPKCTTVKDYYRECARFLLSFALTNILSLHEEDSKTGILHTQISDFSWSYLGLTQMHIIECPAASLKLGLKTLFREWASLISNPLHWEDLTGLLEWTESVLMTKKIPSSPLLMEGLVNYALYKKVSVDVKFDFELFEQFKTAYITPEILLNEWKNGQQVMFHVVYPADMPESKRLSDEAILALYNEELEKVQNVQKKKLLLKSLDVETSNTIPDKVDYTQIQQMEYTLNLTNGVQVLIKEEENNSTEEYQSNFDEYITINATSKFGLAYSVGYLYVTAPDKIHSAFLSTQLIQSMSWGGIKTPNKITDKWFLYDIKTQILQNSFTLITGDTKNLDLLFKVIHCYFTGITVWDKDKVQHEIQELIAQKKAHKPTPEELFTREAIKFNYNNHPLLADVLPEKFNQDDCLAFIHKAFSNPHEYIFTITVPYGFKKIRELIDVATRYMSSFPKSSPSVNFQLQQRAISVLSEELFLRSKPPLTHIISESNPTKGFVLFTFQHKTSPSEFAHLWIIIEVFRTTLNDTLRSSGLTYSVDFQTNSGFYDSVFFTVPCKPNQSHIVALRVIRILKEYAENGFKDSDVEYANNIAQRRRIGGGPIKKETANKLFKMVFWDVHSTIVLLVPEKLKKKAESHFLPSKALYLKGTVSSLQNYIMPTVITVGLLSYYFIYYSRKKKD